MSTGDGDGVRQSIEELLDAVVTTVARVNHQGVRKDDPVMVLPTIMKVISNDAADQHKRVLQEHANEYEDFAYRVRKDSEDVAKRVLNASLEACQQQIAASADNAAKGVKEAIGTEMAAAITVLRSENDNWQKTNGPMVLAGGIFAFLGGVAALAAVVLKIL